jgi:hypothetical protein
LDCADEDEEKSPSARHVKTTGMPVRRDRCPNMLVASASSGGLQQGREAGVDSGVKPRRPETLSVTRRKVDRKNLWVGLLARKVTIAV